MQQHPLRDATIMVGATGLSFALGDRILAGLIGLFFALVGLLLSKILEPWFARFARRFAPRD